MRLAELQPYGIRNVWMHAGIYDEFHFASIIGVSEECWNRFLPHSGLTTKNRYGTVMNYSKWGQILRQEFEYRNYGSDKKIWFRFNNGVNIDAFRDSRSSSSSSSSISNITVGDEQARELVYQFYDRIEEAGVLRDTHCSNLQMLEYIEELERRGAAAAADEAAKAQRREEALAAAANVTSCCRRKQYHRRRRTSPGIRCSVLSPR